MVGWTLGFNFGVPTLVKNVEVLQALLGFVSARCNSDCEEQLPTVLLSLEDYSGENDNLLFICCAQI